MTASLKDIKEWIKIAKKRSCTHLIIACDYYNFDNYPIYITKDMNVRKEYKKIANKENMQGVDEIYNMSMNIEEQLSKPRSFNF